MASAPADSELALDPAELVSVSGPDVAKADAFEAKLAEQLHKKNEEVWQAEYERRQERFDHDHGIRS